MPGWYDGRIDILDTTLIISLDPKNVSGTLKIKRFTNSTSRESVFETQRDERMRCSTQCAPPGSIMASDSFENNRMIPHSEGVVLDLPYPCTRPVLLRWFPPDPSSASFASSISGTDGTDTSVSRYMAV